MTTTHDARHAPATAGVELSAVALIAMTLVAVLSLGRLFTTGVWWPAAFGVALIGHSTSWLGRRMRLSATPAIVGALLCTLVAAMWIALGVPTAQTFSAAGHGLRDAMSAARGNSFPAPLLPGYKLFGAMAVACAAVLAEALSFRARVAVWAVVPSLVLVCTAVALAPPGAVYGWTIAFVAAVGVFWLAHRVERRVGARVQFTGSPVGALAISPIGMALTGVCVAVTIGLAPFLPRADQRAPRVPPRRVPSPLLEVEPLMTREANIEQFTVGSSEPHYWRLATLDVFDGRTWQVSASYDVGDGRLRSKWPRAAGTTVEQAIVISGLKSVWLPAAAVPVRIEGHDAVGWDRVSESLIAPVTTPAFSYRVESVLPQPTVDALRTADWLDVSKEDRERYTALPPLPEKFFGLARDLTPMAPTMFDRAVALQNYFREGHTFAIVPPGHDIATLDRFLFTTRSGTSEQFAAAYALLARASGLPARVAVGFSPGDRGPDGRWHVRGTHAEAWPEVLLGSYGWVPFEPTPGRDVAGATSLRGDVKEGATRSPGGTDTFTPNPNAVASGADGPTTTTTTTPPRQSRDIPRIAGPRWLLIVELVLMAGFLVWASGVPTVRALRRRWRRRSVQTHSEAILLAFEEAAERLADAGLPMQLGETIVEHAGRAARDAALSPARADDLHALAHQASSALYRVAPTHDASAVAAEVTEARTRAHRIRRDVQTSTPAWRRVTWALDPRAPTPSGRAWRRRHDHARRGAVVLHGSRKTATAPPRRGQ